MVHAQTFGNAVDYLSEGDGSYYDEEYIRLTYRPDGSDWVKSGERYIVFLQLKNVYHNDSLNDCVDLEPLYLYSSCASMYPVINGVVYNPHNDLGIGISLTPKKFKAALRQKIAAIVSAY